MPRTEWYGPGDVLVIPTDCPTCINGNRTLSCGDDCPRERLARLSPLVWNSEGANRWTANGQNEGLRDDGMAALAGYVFEITSSYRIAARLRGEEMMTTYLHYLGFTREDAKREAEKMRVMLPRVKNLPTKLIDRATMPLPVNRPQALILPTGKIVVPPGLLNCRGALHAWNTDAGVNETCRCGRITFGLALEEK